MNVVNMDGVEVRRSGRCILGPITWRVAAGEHWVLLGPNGSGKTTLTSIAGAWLHPSSGRAEVLGGALGRVDVRNLRARIGQITHRITESIPPALTVEQVVLTGRLSTLANWPDDVSARDRRRAHELLETVGCRALADRPLVQCSQGERQRVLLGRALFGHPELLVLDEPGAGLDLPGREAVVAALEAASRDRGGRTTILATHHLDEVPPSSSHAALLRDGRILHAGEIDRVLSRESLRDCFAIDLRVERQGRRWSATAVDTFAETEGNHSS